MLTVLHQEYLVLSSTLLSTLGTEFTCPTAALRTALEAEASNNFMFFIEDTFYTNSNDNDDYAVNIMNFVKESGAALRGPAKELLGTGGTVMHHKRMTDITIHELRIRLGFPYLFVHHGCCEHLIVMQEVRLPHAGDAPCTHMYPLLIQTTKNMPKKCEMCGCVVASLAVINGSSLPKSPFRICDDCYNRFKIARPNVLDDSVAIKYVDS